MPSNFQNTREFAELTIASVSTTPTSYELCGTHLIGILMPSAFTGIKLFIEVETIYDNPFNFIRLVSNSAEAGERKIKIICNP